MRCAPLVLKTVGSLKHCFNGKFLIQGVRNKDLRQLLWPAPIKQTRTRNAKNASRITRNLTLLKSHNLIYRVPKNQLLPHYKTG